MVVGGLIAILLHMALLYPSHSQEVLYSNNFAAPYSFYSLVFYLGLVYRQEKYKFALYFPFCRFWETVIGGFIGCSNFRVYHTIFANLLSMGGMISIFTSIWILNEKSLFPWWWALVPTFGAAAIILAGNGSLINTYILSSRPFVFIGEISYSMYLWHWPLLVFSRIFYRKGSKSLLGQTYIIFSITLVLSMLSLYIIENPFRHKKSKFVVIELLIAMISLGAFTYVMSKIL